MSNNYTLGRGEMHFGQFKPTTQIPFAERYLGNTPELGFTAEQESLDHYSSDRGVRIKDQSVLLQLDYAGSFITDNIDPKNLAMFFLGEEQTQTTIAATGISETFTDGLANTTIQLGTTTATPSGARDVKITTVMAGAVTLAAGTDYVADEVLGRITWLEQATMPDLTSVVVTYDQEASTRSRVISKSMTIEGSMRYIAHNPAGDNIDYFMPWVKITPNGDFQLKGDDWQQLSFTIEILKKGQLESFYADGRPYIPTP